MAQLMRIFFVFLITGLVFSSATLVADELERQPLFKIERSKNANIIQYDAQIDPSGKLNKKKPVIGYWIRLAEQGQVKKLSWIQRKFAFGFDTKFHQDSNSATIDMVADIGQPIQVRYENGRYRAIVELDGQSSELETIFIQAHGKGILVKVEYVDIFGKDLATGEETYVRFIP